MKKQKLNKAGKNAIGLSCWRDEMLITENLLTGSEIETCLDDLATLRINIFREYPYLYDGLREDELTYLRLYMVTTDAFVISVNDSGAMIGAATGIPLKNEHDALIEPFKDTSYSVDELFYVGELLFYPSYRDKRLGQRLLKQIAEYVGTLGNYRYLTCATVARPNDHPIRPENYVQIDKFLTRTGFTLLRDITTNFAWKETDGISRDHSMQFWIKEL